MGKNMSRAPYGTPDWWRPSQNPTFDWLIKKSGKYGGRAETLRFSGSLYQKRTHVNYYNSSLK
jgi:hypothetical protein